MGGRLDAVNVIDATVAVVVSIGLDHQEFLGTTHEAIAREKAGIFRADAPAVLGSRDMPEALEDAARAVGAPLKRLGCEFDFRRDGERWCYRGSRWTLEDLPAAGARGRDSICRCGDGNCGGRGAPLERVSPQAVAQGIGTARLEGRFQVIASTGVQWILDVAHNPDAARVLAPISRRGRSRAARSPCAGSSRTRMRWVWRSRSLPASTNGGWRRRRELAAPSTPPSWLLWRRISERRLTQAAASPPPVPAHSRRLAKATDRRLRLVSHGGAGAGLAGAARDAAGRDAHCLYSSHSMNTGSTHDGSTPQRTLGRGHDTGELIVLIVPELLSGPRRPSVPPLAAGLPTTATRSVWVDLATGKAVSAAARCLVRAAPPGCIDRGAGRCIGRRSGNGRRSTAAPRPAARAHRSCPGNAAPGAATVTVATLKASGAERAAA